MSDTVRQRKRIVGAVSTILIIIFLILYLTRFIDLILFLAATIGTWAVANLILRRIGKQ